MRCCIAPTNIMRTHRTTTCFRTSKPSGAINQNHLVNENHATKFFSTTPRITPANPNHGGMIRPATPIKSGERSFRRKFLSDFVDAGSRRVIRPRKIYRDSPESPGASARQVQVAVDPPFHPAEGEGDDQGHHVVDRPGDQEQLDRGIGLGHRQPGRPHQVDQRDGRGQ